MTTSSCEKIRKTLPTIREWPLIGSLYSQRQDPSGFYLRVMRECGDIGLFHVGPARVILITAYELAYRVLVEQASGFDKGELVRKAYQPFLGNGLLFSEGDFHQRQRKVVAPFFQPRHISAYAEMMAAYSEQLQRDWKEGECIDICRAMGLVTMNIAGKVVFDVDALPETTELSQAIATVVDFTNYTLTSLLPFPLNWPVPRSRRAKRALTTLDDCIFAMIEARQRTDCTQTDILSCLLTAQTEDGARMSKRQIRDEALTLFGAGQETTATALIWAWHLLTQHPAIYQKLQQEVDTALQGRTPTYADLARLPYALQVLKESLRLYPPVYIIPRAALHDMELGGYPIRRGEKLLIAVSALHRQPELYPDPEQFIPERFAPEREKQLPRLAYLPFGAGPRVCLGNHFAMMEGQIVLTTLAQRITLTLPEQRVQRTSTMRPQQIQMVVRRRVST
jgi:cytochrome P450